ncbi:hypothetical protein Goari_014333, partial [Gossypium aridum]|nr:hypothetical protein [Gossypium aridum]
IYEETESLVRQFIWGSSNGKRKLALINRESLGFCLVTNINTLWVKVLRSKYRLKDNLHESIMANNGSFLSKVLLKIWPLFRDNLIRSVGMAPNSKGHFPLKSAYWSPKEDYWNPKDPMWKTSWNFKGPQRELVKKHLTQFVVILKKALCMFLEADWWLKRFGDRIWKNINFFVFQGSTWEATKIIKVFITWAEQFWITHNEALNRRLTNVQRNSPLRLRNFEHWVVRHVPREANLVVDRIANMVVVDMEGVNVLAIAPTDLLEALQSDKDNGPFDCTSVV